MRLLRFARNDEFYGILKFLGFLLRIRWLGVRGYFLGNSLWGILDFSGVLGPPRVQGVALIKFAS